MTLYLWIKLLHILSSTVLFGTGMGIAFFMLKAYLSNNDEAMEVTTRHVVVADWLFTAPAVVMVDVFLLHLGRKLRRSLYVTAEPTWCEVDRSPGATVSGRGVGQVGPPCLCAAPPSSSTVAPCGYVRGLALVPAQGLDGQPGVPQVDPVQG